MGSDGIGINCHDWHVCAYSNSGGSSWMPITTCSCFDDNELLLTGSLAFEAKSESLALSIISASFRELVFFLLSLQCVVAVPILRSLIHARNILTPCSLENLFIPPFNEPPLTFAHPQGHLSYTDLRYIIFSSCRISSGATVAAWLVTISSTCD